MTQAENNEEKAKLREGDSPRARVFRTKDELFQFNYDELMSFLREKELPAVNERLVLVHKNLQTLSEKPDDEEKGKETIETLQSIMTTLNENGFQEFLSKKRDGESEES